MESLCTCKQTAELAELAVWGSVGLDNRSVLFIFLSLVARVQVGKQCSDGGGSDLGPLGGSGAAVLLCRRGRSELWVGLTTNTQRLLDRCGGAITGGRRRRPGRSELHFTLHRRSPMVPGADVGGDELRQSATNCQTEGAGVRAGRS